MKSPGYRISEAAIKDLKEIWEYTSHKWSSEQADRYYNLIINEVEFLSTNAFAGKPIDYIRKGYRSATVKSHLIFYRIADDQKIEVIRILHQSMDIDERMITKK